MKMRRAALLAMLAPALAQQKASSGSYVEEHVQPRVAGVLSEFLKKPIDLLQWSQAAESMGSVAETEAFRRLSFTQVLSQAAERGDSSVSMIYGAYHWFMLHLRAS